MTYGRLDIRTKEVTHSILCVHDINDSLAMTCLNVIYIYFRVLPIAVLPDLEVLIQQKTKACRSCRTDFFSELLLEKSSIR